MFFFFKYGDYYGPKSMVAVLVKEWLEKLPSHRTGCGIDGWEEIKRSPFFCHLPCQTTTARTRRSRKIFKKIRDFFEVFGSFRKFLEVRGRVWTCSDLPGCVRMRSDAFGCVRTVAFVPCTGEPLGAENLRIREKTVSQGLG